MHYAKGAAEIGADFVYSCKPNPAFLAMNQFSQEQTCTDLTETGTACEENGWPLEFILKHISTVCYKPRRLFEWACIAMHAVAG